MKFDLLVLGSGPGGYVAAIRAAQLGMQVGIVERESLGGVCLNWGCIPTKALLKSAQVFEYIKHADAYGISVGAPKADFTGMVKRSRGVADSMSKGVQFLMKKNKITVLQGNGRLVRGKKVEVTDDAGKKEVHEASHIIIATGARAKELPNLTIDGEHIIEYRKAMSMEKQPKTMVVVGAGAIGVEFAYFYHSIGTEVTVVEFLEQGLVPREDADISKELARWFKKSGIAVRAGASVEKVDTKGKQCAVTVKDRKSGKEEVIECDVVLSAVGVTPNIEDIGLEALGIKTDKGMISVDQFYQTNVPGIYAIGDVIPGPALAHVASAEGILCVEKIQARTRNPLIITTCHPVPIVLRKSLQWDIPKHKLKRKATRSGWANSHIQHRERRKPWVPRKGLSKSSSMRNMANGWVHI